MTPVQLYFSVFAVFALNVPFLVQKGQKWPKNDPKNDPQKCQFGRLAENFWVFGPFLGQKWVKNGPFLDLAILASGQNRLYWYHFFVEDEKVVKFSLFEKLCFSHFFGPLEGARKRLY